jgi:hypothetical protein
VKPIQYVVALGFLFLGYLFQVRRKSLGKALSRLSLISFTMAALVAVLFPNVFQLLAEIVGVGRGADLLIYLMAFSTVSFIFLTLAKIKQIESEITVLTREIALIAEDTHSQRHAN